MEKFKLEDEQRQALMEGASWDRAGLELVDQAVEAIEEDGTYQKLGTADLPGDVNPTKGLKPAVPATKKDADMSRKAQGSEGLAEDSELEYVCPLCESHLDEELSEERISEHIDFVVGLLSEEDEAEGDTLAEEEDPEEEITSEEDNG